jgi:hypothetical protein
MITLKRIELLAVWRYGLKKRNGCNNSSGIRSTPHTIFSWYCDTLWISMGFSA